MAHVILVAFEVSADDRTDAQEKLIEVLPVPETHDIESWWIAEDDRIDGSDNHSAVFVPFGQQDSLDSFAESIIEGRNLSGE